MKQIILIFRRPFPGQISIEYLFYSISDHLQQKNIPMINDQLLYYSKGIINRIKNLFTLVRFQDKIVHVTGDVHYAILGAWFSKRVLTVHDLGFMVNKGRLSRFVYWLIWLYLPVKFAHKVTVVSNSTKLALLKHVKCRADKVVVIGNFIDGIYKPFAKPYVNAQPRLLQVGTAFNKNIERLIQAISGMPCTLVIIGHLDPQLATLLAAKQINYENKFDLSIAELYEEYKKSDLLCYVSTLEGFGMPILEAQATGIPVICSNISSMPEVAGKGAYFVNPLDISGIRNGIDFILNNDIIQNKLLTQGFKNVKRYSKEAVAAEYLNIYNNLSSRKIAQTL